MPLHITKFSEIFVCRDTDLEIDVCIKVFKPQDSVLDGATVTVEYWRERFLREAKVMARLDHPHIVPLKDYALDGDGNPFIVMPFYPATLKYEIGKDTDDPATLRRLPPKRRAKAVSVPRATAVWRQVLQALAAMHGFGLVHRDIKPGNLLLTAKRQGDVKVCDFGLVQVPGLERDVGRHWLGTKDYAPPEQRRKAAAVDPRADVFAAGVLAFRMLAGRLPKSGEPFPGAKAKGCPAELGALIDACRARDRADRPADAAAVLARLDELV